MGLSRLSPAHALDLLSWIGFRIPPSRSSPTFIRFCLLTLSTTGEDDKVMYIPYVRVWVFTEILESRTFVNSQGTLETPAEPLGRNRLEKKKRKKKNDPLTAALL